MSTKTTLKRIALVAVSALGFGLMTSTAPASALAVEPTSITVGTIPAASVGTVHAQPVTIAFPGTDTGSDTFAISVRVTSAPSGSGYKNFNTNLATGEITPGTNVKAKVTITYPTSNDGLGTTAAGTSSTSSVDGSTVAMLYTSSIATGTADKASFLINVTPDIAGTYTVLVSTRDTVTAIVAATLPIYTAGDASASYSFATGATPTTATLATVTGAQATGTQDHGRLMKITLNAGAVLNTGETITLSTNNSTATLGIVTSQTDGTTSSPYSATQTLDSTHFVDGVAYFKLKEYLDKGRLKILNDLELKNQMLTIKYKYGSDGKKQILSKDEMKKEGLKSPDCVESLMMALFHNDDIIGLGENKSRMRQAKRNQVFTV
jgi:hypothetical protein